MKWSWTSQQLSVGDARCCCTKDLTKMSHMWEILVVKFQFLGGENEMSMVI